MANVISQAVSIIKNWWVFSLSGILLIVGSIWVFFTPVESYVTLAWLFSVLVLANGISYVYFSISNHKELEGWGWYLAGGIFEIILGAVLIYYPDLSIMILPLFVGFWFMFRGAQIVAASLELKKYGFLDWGWLMLFGIALSIMSFFMILDPLFGFFNIVYLTSLALLLFGVSNIMISLNLKKIKSKTIDKVEEFKKNAKKDLISLKDQVIEKMKETSTDVKGEVDAAFREYQSKLD
jgi:uncharacterized membrane protein HdeD (DUF308 family)